MPEFIARHLPTDDADISATEFLIGYLEAAEFTFSDVVDGEEIEAPPDDCEGWHPEAIERASQECLRFVSENLATLGRYAELMAQIEGGDSPARCAGRDFYFTRGHAGVGFWSREGERGQAQEWREAMGEVGELLTAAAHSFGEVSSYVGDDKFLYFG